ncbi:hypothetical protein CAUPRSCDRAFT_12275 [Caulochytrium protostelioides]|uniref:Uncharacterized protein n=1 Tax=Caulochytrium protostelioides TaxID=1555241 RepID=A0A4P9WTL5_9FUNG|nr:hypothetical protein CAUPRSCDRAFT_12275 [Caulochytrium protostelioides]
MGGRQALRCLLAVAAAAALGRGGGGDGAPAWQEKLWRCLAVRGGRGELGGPSAGRSRTNRHAYGRRLLWRAGEPTAAYPRQHRVPPPRGRRVAVEVGSSVAACEPSDDADGLSSDLTAARDRPSDRPSDRPADRPTAHPTSS